MTNRQYAITRAAAEAAAQEEATATQRTATRQYRSPKGRRLRVVRHPAPPSCSNGGHVWGGTNRIVQGWPGRVEECKRQGCGLLRLEQDAAESGGSGTPLVVYVRGAEAKAPAEAPALYTRMAGASGTIPDPVCTGDCEHDSCHNARAAEARHAKHVAARKAAAAEAFRFVHEIAPDTNVRRRERVDAFCKEAAVFAAVAEARGWTRATDVLTTAAAAADHICDKIY